MKKAYVYEVMINPITVEVHEADNHLAIEEAQRKINNGEVDIEEAEYSYEKDCDCGCNEEEII